MRRWIWRVLLAAVLMAALTGTALAADTIVVQDGIKYDLSTGTVVRNEDNTGIKTAVIKSAVRGVPITGIANGAFSGFAGLGSLTIPSSITEIGANAFRNCENLGSVIIPENVVRV